MERKPFSARRVGTAGHEIREPNGNIVGWAIDGTWAALIAALLNRVEAEGLGCLDNLEHTLARRKKA